MNHLTIIGNLTANPAGRVAETQEGAKTVCEFTVATSRISKGEKVADYFRVTLWEKDADNAMKYLSKGSKVCVTGPVTGRAYLGKDGQPRVSLEIRRVRDIEYLSSKPQSGEESQEPEEFGSIEEPDGDLPF